MQAARLIAIAGSALAFLARHPYAVGAAIVVLAVLLALELRWVRKHSPKDLTGNGITIGQAKAFDSSSLTLRLQRLNAGLEALKIVNQNITENLSAVQERTSTESITSYQLKTVDLDKKDSGGKSSADGKKEAGGEAKAAPPAEGKPNIGLTAGDALTNQLNLVSQVFNLQTQYEGSLSDRMFASESRLQSVLGFQVSISTPSGYEDCVAVVEMAVRTKAIPAAGANPAVPARPVSLVALMPQEKTYTAESTARIERSLEGSAVLKIVTLGLGGRRTSRGAFIRRDPETVAFERKPSEVPALLENATTFGWEFRPELGRRAVAPGLRQLMAVIATPVSDAANAAQEPDLEIKTRTYWRRYASKRQTSAPARSWLPWRVDRSGESTSTIQTLGIPNTAKIQETLAAKVGRVEWAETGGGKAYVTVMGRNFFPGTRVLIGGQQKQEKDGTLTLKSEQVLEFESPVESLLTADAVVIGRYGRSVKLEDKRARAVYSLAIGSASIRPMRNAKLLRLTVDIFGQDTNGNPQPFNVAQLSELPDPILCVGNEAVPRPYDFSDQVILAPSGTNVNALRVEAWISASALAKSREVSFRVPFCSLDYYINQPMAFSEPTVMRMGSDANNTVFRVSLPVVSTTQPVEVELDQTYYPNNPENVLVPTGVSNTGTPTEYRFTVSTALVSRYQNMVVRVSKGEPYVIAIPQEEKPPARAVLDNSLSSPRIKQGKRGSVEFQGTSLDQISTITFTPAATSATAATPVPQEFTTYSGGKQLIVYLSTEATAQEGKVVLDCNTTSGATLKLIFFVEAS